MKGRETHQKIELYPARRAHAASIARMSRDLIEQGLGWTWKSARVERALTASDTLAVVASRGTQMLGFAIMTCGEERAHLVLFAVSPQARRTGLGSRLLAWLEACAIDAGVSQITLEVRATARDARAFYEARGFEPVRLLHGYYQKREHGVAMQKDLLSAPSGMLEPEQEDPLAYIFDNAARGGEG